MMTQNNPSPPPPLPGGEREDEPLVPSRSVVRTQKTGCHVQG